MAMVLRVNNLSQAQIGEILTEAIYINGKATPYGACKAISACNYIPNIDNFGGMFCSELVAQCYSKAGINLGNKAPRDTVPADIEKSNLPLLYFKGYLKYPGNFVNQDIEFMNK